MRRLPGVLGRTNVGILMLPYIKLIWLKLSNDIQYVLNAKGSTPAEVMGIDYKSTLKPSLESFADEINKSSMEKLEELISLQQQSSEMAAKIEGKRNRIAALQSYIDEVEAQLNLLRKEMQ
ncbi:hypothetical protein Dsin_013392 [Dipteronia sinensis]|uniref:Uncharacterized protein n=1 Tax=Dipteronia sinensis TaxID=43782 RepID=A0AAE0AJY8_9ROSI|nr:hypothetical protein Dsin_013392 [Dipteronia sinensis]